MDDDADAEGLRMMMLERFAAKIDTTGECWLWTGALTDRGYGSFRAGRSSMGAHRFAAILHYRQPLDGWLVMHTCGDRRCVRPSHLTIGDAAANTAEAALRQAWPNQRKSSCPRGHELAGANLVVSRRGNGRPMRQCRRCKVDGQRARRAAARAGG